jgi:hypothetical protein
MAVSLPETRHRFATIQNFARDNLRVPSLFRLSLALVVVSVTGASCASASVKVDRSALRVELIARLSSSGGARNELEAQCLADAASGLTNADFALMAKGRAISAKASKLYGAAAVVCGAAA